MTGIPTFFILKNNKMTFEEQVERAKQHAREIYEILVLDMYGSINEYCKNRKWRKVMLENGIDYCYALTGTPDKMFVYCFPNERIIKIVRPDGYLIKEIEVMD